MRRLANELVTKTDLIISIDEDLHIEGKQNRDS